MTRCNDPRECGRFHCWCCDMCMNLSDAPCCSNCKDCTNVRRCGYIPPTKLDSFNSNVNVTNTMTEFQTTIEAAKMRSGVNVAGEITKVSDTRTVNLKSGGTVNVADATLTDEVGEIALTLWGDDIIKCPKGAKVSITNGFTNEFKGQVSVTKGKFGQLEVNSL